MERDTNEHVNPVALSARVVMPAHVVHRSFGSQDVALNLETGQYHGLNRTASEMLAALSRNDSLDDALTDLARRYARSRRELRPDLDRLCRALAHRGLVEIRDGGHDSS